MIVKLIKKATNNHKGSELCVIANPLTSKQLRRVLNDIQMWFGSRNAKDCLSTIYTEQNRQILVFLPVLMLSLFNFRYSKETKTIIL